MNGNNISPHIMRFLGLVAVQGLLLNQMTETVGSYFNVLLYPLFILFLPLQLAAPYLVILGFAVGFAVDATVPSWGVHASAGAFSGVMRGIAFMPFAPKGGFSPKDPIFSPEYMGWQTFLQGHQKAAAVLVLTCTKGLSRQCLQTEHRELLPNVVDE